MVFCLPVPTPRYEDEINKRTAAENDFVVLKKVSQALFGIVVSKEVGARSERK